MMTTGIYKIYTYKNEMYVSVLSLYRSGLFPRFFKPIYLSMDEVGEDCRLLAKWLRRIVNIYHVPSEKYILVFTKDSLYGEPYLREDYIQVMEMTNI